LNNVSTPWPIEGIKPSPASLLKGAVNARLVGRAVLKEMQTAVRAREKRMIVNAFQLIRGCRDGEVI
jgi:hypothetical protein